MTAPAVGASLAGTVAVSANASDASGVASVQFTLDGDALGAADTAAPYSLSWDTTKAADGPHTLAAVARDASGNAATSATVAVQVHNTGLVAAYGFDEPSGTAITDAMSAHSGTVSGATRVAGRYGQGLSFDGVDDFATVPHDASLNLGSGMTVEAWVRPSALTSLRSVVTKQAVGQLAYALYANSATDQPLASVFTTSAMNASGGPALGTSTWTHLAMTWDGGVVRLYLDGAEVATHAATGSLATGTGELRIGGNSLQGQFFSGIIDEVRIYDRALTPGQIGADMNAPVDG
jgi:hypothetical protein